MFEVYKNYHELDSTKPLVVGFFKEQETVKVDENIDVDLKELFSQGFIKKEVGKVTKVHTLKKIKNSIIFLVCLGKEKEYSLEKLEESLRNINYKLGDELIIDLASFVGDLNVRDVAKRMVQTINYYNYAFDQFLSEKVKNNLILKFVTDQDITEAINEAFNLSVAINNTRDLVNTPYNHLSAEDLANYAQELVANLNDNRVKIRVYDKKEIEEFGMYAFLGVNKGSSAEPKLIHIQYEGANIPAIGLVGKGLMFDTGGYTLKQNMINMKGDMAGAATVLGVLEAAVKNNIATNLHVVICATDNRINGEALLPDDILTAMNKKTIEVISTDAEGRLTLADAVCFAQKEGCKEVIDVATLTGAVVVALGDYVTGLFGNDQAMIDKMIIASKDANEEFWHLPINDDIRKQVRSSKVADLMNSTGRLMGASSGAAFIEAFIENDTKWLHLDIAGTAFRTSPRQQEYYGATGAAVKTLYNYLRKLS